MQPHTILRFREFRAFGLQGSTQGLFVPNRKPRQRKCPSKKTCSESHRLCLSQAETRPARQHVRSQLYAGQSVGQERRARAEGGQCTSCSDIVQMTGERDDERRTDLGNLVDATVTARAHRAVAKMRINYCSCVQR